MLKRSQTLNNLIPFDFDVEGTSSHAKLEREGKGRKRGELKSKTWSTVSIQPC